jgi:aerobic-type carbon monoxide dehydrogenase small subunit (CoxS/CutS family)
VEPLQRLRVVVEINGGRYERDVDARRLLVHFLSDDLDLTATRVGCDTGNCGACTVLLGGPTVKSCTLLAVQAHGTRITTAEGLAPIGELTPLQRSISANYALQCGYCTPGMLVSATYLFERNAHPNKDEIRRGIQRNIYRCPGHVNIVRAIQTVAERDD